MSQNWDLANLRKIAGLAPIVESKQQLSESWDGDDDDEDPDVKIANSDKRQDAFEKKNKGNIKRAEKEADARAAHAKKTQAAKKAAPAAKPAEKKEEPKKEEPKAEAEKKADAPAEAKRRGKAPNPDSFNQWAKAYAKTHSRASFIAAAAEKGKGKNYASAMFAKYNPKSSREQQKANEMWVITHPFLKNYLLSENRELNVMQWVDDSSDREPSYFVTEADAQKVVKYMNEWKSQSVGIEHIVLENDDEIDVE